MNNVELFDLLEKVEFCDIDTGKYYRAVAVANESTGVVVTIRAANDDI